MCGCHCAATVCLPSAKFRGTKHFYLGQDFPSLGITDPSFNLLFAATIPTCAATVGCGCAFPLRNSEGKNTSILAGIFLVWDSQTLPLTSFPQQQFQLVPRQWVCGCAFPLRNSEGQNTSILAGIFLVWESQTLPLTSLPQQQLHLVP